MVRRLTFVVIALTFLVSAQLFSQTFRGGVSGSVTDASGATVTGAAVKLVSPDTGLDP